MRQGGFTLIELVMIIVLAGILAVYAGSRATPDFTAIVAADELREAIRHAQQHAMDNTGIASQPGIQIDNDGFIFLNITSPGIRWNLQKPGPSYAVNINPTGRIFFNGRGEPTNCTGGIDCTSTNTFTITANSETASFSVEPHTGLTH